jgi:hypothetical protein
MSLVILLGLWGIAFTFCNLAFFGKGGVKTRNQVLIVFFLATGALLLVLTAWRRVAIWWHLTLFDLDGNGFVDGSEITDDARKNEPSTADTWRTGLLFVGPMIYLLFGFVQYAILRAKRSNG